MPAKRQKAAAANRRNSGSDGAVIPAAAAAAVSSTDLSEQGQLGAIFVQLDGNDADSEAVIVRRSGRKRRKVDESSENVQQLSSYFSSQLKAAGSKGGKVEKKGQPGKQVESVASVKAKRTRKAHKPKEEPADDLDDPASATPPDTSLFPSLALKLHGLASDRQGSFYGLVQELLTPDVFGMLVVTILLNQTTGRAAIPVFYEIMHRWPTPRLLGEADEDELREKLRPIGLFNIRAKRLKEVGRVWCEAPPRWGVTTKSRVVMPASWAMVDEPAEEGAIGSGDTKAAKAVDPDARKLKRTKTRPLYPATEISHLPGVGRYALDSYLLFRPSRSHLSMASVQIDLCRATALPKPTSDPWQKILDRRVELGDRRDVGELLPPVSKPEGESEGHDSVNPDEDWRNVDALDKELKAYMLWRLGRDASLREAKKE
ncbi:DNA glycosylase [Microstroma glucosiphilum]|uniref:DNA glycosylase n=1 Tax=Pseudomicrostroma glucosiphilum TaxID=1684307 RepID=A0A316TZW7_9BASI|nr:DNA glycosylase [Pseudomicrostroma glucosiphilum]PWN18726.1 DNA glycosylase [Pseudomicrostroma glucosiphilum]